jgi:ribonuclease R
VLNGGDAESFQWTPVTMASIGQQSSITERRADEATRSALSWLKCEYMSDKLGEEFDAMVTGVVDFGLFAQIKGLQVDGLIHVSGLGADYFSRDRSGYRMVGARSGRTFRLGDHLRVRLVNVVIDERKIDFELAAPAGSGPADAGDMRQRVRGPWQRRRRRP